MQEIEEEEDDAAMRQYILETESKSGPAVNGPRWLRPLAPDGLGKKKGKAPPSMATEVIAEEDNEFKQERVGPGKRQVMPEWWQNAGDASSSELRPLLTPLTLFTLI